MTGITVEHDPEWLPEDHKAHLEWQGEQDRLCSGCGHPKDETMADPDLPGAIRWVADPYTCNACAEMEAAARSRAEDVERRESGLKWGVHQAEPLATQ